jgi:hypothetical protein
VLTLQKSLRNLLCTGQCIHQISINPLSVSEIFLRQFIQSLLAVISSHFISLTWSYLVVQTEQGASEGVEQASSRVPGFVIPN